MAKLSIDNGMQVNSFHAYQFFYLSYFQADITTGMKIEEICYSQVIFACCPVRTCSLK